MKTATISQFKAHISENLRAVRAGESMVIMDRNTAVAEVVPIRGTIIFRDTPPRRPFRVVQPPSILMASDAADYLALERGSD